MSYTVKDSLGGKRIALVYDADLIMLPAGGRRYSLAKSRQAGRHMRQHRARAALFLTAGGHADHWWAARTPGVLFAAGIIQWLYTDVAEGHLPEDGAPPLTEVEKPGDFRVAIPLDGRVYLCTVADRMIAEELVLPPDQAIQHLVGEFSSGSSGMPIYAWQVGEKPADTAGEVDEVVPLEPAPFTVDGIRLKPLWLAFAGNGLVHASHFLFTGLAVFLVLASLLLRPAMDVANEIDLAENPVESIAGALLSLLGFGKEPDIVTEVPEMREILPAVPHGAAAELRRLSAWLSTAESLYRDGVANFQWSGGRILLDGRSPPRQYPATAEALAVRNGGEFRITPEGWFLSLPDDMPVEPPATPVIDSAEVIRYLTELPQGIRFASGPDPVPRRVDVEANTFTRELASTSWQLDVKDTAVGELRMLAESLEGWPGLVTGASCALADYRMRNCQINLSITSL